MTRVEGAEVRLGFVSRTSLRKGTPQSEVRLSEKPDFEGSSLGEGGVKRAGRGGEVDVLDVLARFAGTVFAVHPHVFPLDR